MGWAVESGRGVMSDGDPGGLGIAAWRQRHQHLCIDKEFRTRDAEGLMNAFLAGSFRATTSNIQSFHRTASRLPVPECACDGQLMRCGAPLFCSRHCLNRRHLCGLTPLRMARCKMDDHVRPPAPPRWPAPKPDRPLSTALVTARPPLSRNGRRQRGFVPDVRSAGARRLVRSLHAAVCLLISRPTAHICQPHAEPMRGPIGPGQTEGGWTWSTEGGQGWASSLSKSPGSHLHLGLGVVCLFGLVFTRGGGRTGLGGQ